jgi:hypothetical protein
MQDMQFVEVRNVELPRGGTLEVQLTQDMISRIGSQFGVAQSNITDEHVRMFIWGAVKSAIEKAEFESV